MKKSYIKIAIMLSITCFILLLNSFILKNFNQFILMFLLIILIGIEYFTNGFDRSHKRFEKDILLIILITMSSYYLITYLSGLFLGFTYSTYSSKLINIIKNILPVLVIIFLSEILRFSINSKIKEKNMLLVLSLVTFFLLDTTLVISSLDYGNTSDLIDNISLFILPSVSMNLLLTYLSIKTSYKVGLTYRYIKQLPVYLLPIFPALGSYLQAILEFSISILVFVMVYNLYSKLPNNKRKIIIKNKNYKFLYIASCSLLLIVISFTSGLFSRQAIVIATGSMTPNINRGDVVIVRKLKNEEKAKLEEGDILVFKRDTKVVVHRIYKKVKSGNEIFYETKGDNNKDPDGYYIELDEVIGTTKTRIRYIGYPTIIIYDLFN